MTDRLSRESKDISECPTPLDLPAFLPYACWQLQAPFELRVVVELQDEYVSRAADEKSKKGKAAKPNVGQQASATFESATHKAEESRRAVAAAPADDEPDAVVALAAVYDAAGHLVELALRRARRVPRLLMQILALCVPFHPALARLTVRWGPLGGLALYEIAQMLRLSRITEICFDDSPVPECNYYLLLDEATHLRSLSLARCLLEDRDAAALAARLGHPRPASRSLLLLSLASNRITDAGAAALAAALRTNRTLQYLNLSGNRVGDEGAGLLLGTLMEFPLTYEELVAKRQRLLDHLRLKDEVTRRCYAELMTDRSTDDLGRGGRRRQRRSSAELGARAQAMAAELVGPHRDPFGAAETVARGSRVYAAGNSALVALNLAYNELSWASVVRLQAVLRYQERRRGGGLLRALLDGNALPACAELAAVQALLDRALSSRLAKPKSKLDRISRVRPR